MTQPTPDDIPDLESVISTAELERRPSRAPDYAAENRALVALAQEMVVSTNNILQKLVETALTLCRAHSAGISMLDDERKRFRWIAIAGRWAEYVGGSAPRHASPSGTVLDRNVPLLVSHPERHFGYLASVTPLIDEGLLIPFRLDSEAVATIWVVAHDDGCRFDMEDLRLMTNLGNFAAAACQIYVTERKRAEQTLRDSEEQYRLVVETATDAVISIDESSQIVFVNPATERIFGYTSSELLGQSLTMLMPEPMRPRHHAGIRRYLRTGEPHIDWHGAELVGRRKDGEEFPIEVAFGQIARNGEHRFTGYIRDISERKHAEAALRSTQTALAHVARFTTMAALSASISHEVRQPLAAIITNGDACLRLLAPDKPNLVETRVALASMIRDAKRAVDVVARVRAFLKKSAVERTPLHLEGLIREMLLLVQSEVTRHGIVMRTSLSNDLPPVLGDRIHLQQVVLNLMTNSIDAMRDVADRPRELTVSAHRHEIGAGGGVRVAVEDTGVGFDRADAERLFEALYTTKPDGLGMGLSISRSIVEAYQGRLWGTPNAGYGATFQFVLPAWDGSTSRAS